MKKAIEKLKMSAGFTLAETLMTVLILVMVSGVVAGGIPAAVKAYSKAVDAANAQVLISTTVNALRGELSTAQDVHLKDGNLIYISPYTGSKTKLYIGDDTIMVQDFLTFDESVNSSVDPRSLVSESAKTKNLQVSYSSVTWQTGKENEVLVFDGLSVTKNGTTIVSVDDLYIRCLGVGMARAGSTS